jgi:hypothetical protein
MRLEDVLLSWSGIQSYPDLFAAALDDDALSVQHAETLLLLGISRPRTCYAAILELVERGEFSRAEELVRDSRFGLGDEERRELTGRLVAARRAYQELLEARLLDLSLRAKEAHDSLEKPENLVELALQRTQDAEAFLAASEEKISLSEARTADELRDALAATNVDKGLEDGWVAAVEHAVAAKQFDAARFLLDAGPAAGTGVLPATVARRPPWPWREPLDEILGWFGAAGANSASSPPPEFYSRWAANPEDVDAKRLVDALAAVALGTPDVSTVGALGEALDSFLGSTGESKPQVLATAGAFVMPLEALRDERVAAIAPLRDGEVWVTVGDVPHGERPSVLLSLGEPAREGTASVDAVGILRLVGEPVDRRVNFLRDIGRQLDLRTSISTADAGAAGLSADANALRWQLAWTLDVLDVDADPTVPDVANHLCGGRAGLLLLLLAEALERLSSRNERLTLEVLVDASAASHLHDQVRSRFTRSLDEALSRAVFGTTALLAETQSAAVSPDEVRDALAAFWSVEIPTTRVIEALARLAEDDLVRCRNDGHFALANGIAATAVVSVVGDLEPYVSAALGEVSST